MTQTRIDWSQIWYPGPRQAFTPEQLARAGAEGPSATLLISVALNVAAMVFLALKLAPVTQMKPLIAALLALAAFGGASATWLWQQPWRRPLMLVSVALIALLVLGLQFIRWQLPAADDRFAVTLTLAIGGSSLTVVLWFLVVWRSQQIGARLRELDERDKAVEMARRLAAAQIEPHFLFNTLASLQHWVETQDRRAGPLLSALTGYLRATLPLFRSPLLRAQDELVAIEHYLQVMQARFGSTRLQWRIDVAPALREAALPPGMLLTLVENAVEHGIEPQLSGGLLTVRARRDGQNVLFEVSDNGPGPASDAVDGVGLANVRQRLALAAGDAAHLSLTRPTEGGCRAEISLPYREST